MSPMGKTSRKSTSNEGIRSLLFHFQRYDIFVKLSEYKGRKITHRQEKLP
ncbi:hypothetical protein HMPREF1869_00714 [Bacteroidales bacterium KA00251]|nr:hypothetical protein HMPREF1869_00714 [Bacteroidales bacterium KA00251]